MPLITLFSTGDTAYVRDDTTYKEVVVITDHGHATMYVGDPVESTAFWVRRDDVYAVPFAFGDKAYYKGNIGIELRCIAIGLSPDVDCCVEVVLDDGQHDHVDISELHILTSEQWDQWGVED